jgi:hypothetical protein
MDVPVMLSALSGALFKESPRRETSRLQAEKEESTPNRMIGDDCSFPLAEPTDVLLLFQVISEIALPSRTDRFYGFTVQAKKRKSDMNSFEITRVVSWVDLCGSLIKERCKRRS